MHNNLKKFLSELECLYEIGETNISNLKWCENPNEAIKNASGIAILTDWSEFCEYDYEAFYKEMKHPAYVFDYRRMLKFEKITSIGFNIIQFVLKFIIFI